MTLSSERPARAAITTLIIIQSVMLLALFALSAPHPPASIPLFAIAPFLAVSLSAATCALILGPVSSTSGRVFSIVAALLGLLSFGPQKYFDIQFSLIWPAVIAGQIAAITLFYTSFAGKICGAKSEA